MSIDINDIDELAEVKLALRITHSDDDELLQRLLQSATRECLRFLNSTELPTAAADTSIDYGFITGVITADTVDILPDIFNGIVLMVQADYEGDPTKRDIYRRSAESLWTPYRSEMGV